MQQTRSDELLHVRRRTWPQDLYSEDVEGMGLIGVAFAKTETRKIKRRMRRPLDARDRARLQRLGVKTVLGNQWTMRSLRITLANPQ